MVRDEPTCDHQLSGKEMKSWHYWDAISNVEDYQNEPASNQPICLATSHHGWTIHISPDRMPGLFHFGRIPFLQSTNWWVRVLHSRGKLPQSRHVSTTDIREISREIRDGLKKCCRVGTAPCLEGKTNGWFHTSEYIQTGSRHPFQSMTLHTSYGTWWHLYRIQVCPSNMMFCWCDTVGTATASPTLRQVAGVEIVPTSALDKEQQDTSFKQFGVLRCPSMSLVYYLQ